MEKSDRVKRFEEILKNFDGEKKLYLNPNSQEKLSSLNPEELLSTALKWSNLSAQGLVCGILGCSEEPGSQCTICQCHYCYDHLKWHVHSLENTGILEKDSSEMR